MTWGAKPLVRPYEIWLQPEVQLDGAHILPRESMRGRIRAAIAVVTGTQDNFRSTEAYPVDGAIARTPNDLRRIRQQQRVSAKDPRSTVGRVSLSGGGVFHDEVRDSQTALRCRLVEEQPYRAVIEASRRH